MLLWRGWAQKFTVHTQHTCAMEKKPAIFSLNPLICEKVCKSRWTPAAVLNLRLTLSQQAPSSTNSHQNSKTREILSPRPYQPPRQQKQTGDWRSEGERERGRVTRTEEGGAGWVKEKGRRHNNRRGKLFRSRERRKTLTIQLSERGSCHREIVAKHGAQTVVLPRS